MRTPAFIVSVVLFASAIRAQNALRVVVIEGEDAVNIVQQQTAVRPVVEVRDRNNLPVPGAIVTFSIEGGKAATFGGASTLTVATNAAGQAAVTGLTPSAAGAFQIQVSAAFQGQVATATIAQTNVMTAAQAAAASAASGGGTGGPAGVGAGGAAGGGGGGLSTTTIAIAGAAVAGGAIVATQIDDKTEVVQPTGGDLRGSFSGTITGTVVGAITNCGFTRSASAQARLRFDERSEASVRGSFEYEGSDFLTATTCVGNAPPPAFVGKVDFTGTPSRFSGRTNFPLSFPDGTTGEHTYLFDGSLSGETATGTFRYEQRFVAPGIAGPINTVTAGTFAITFTRQ